MPSVDPGFLDRFHAGEPAVLEACYHEHFDAVAAAVARVLGGPDRETVVQEVFCRLVASEALRRNFRGGSMSAWIATVARNLAIDYGRRHRREVALTEASREASDGGRFTEWADANLLIDRFRREVLPGKWEPVFQARFLDQLSQREAAKKLGLRRTTLVYQELRVQALLRRFLVGTEDR